MRKNILLSIISDIRKSEIHKKTKSMSRFKETCLVFIFISFNIIFQEISGIENSTAVKYENVKNRSTKPGLHNDHQRATGLYEQVNEQPETPICVIETKGQGQYDNNKHYENSAFDKTEKKNVYDGLKISEDDHPYADMEVK